MAICPSSISPLVFLGKSRSAENIGHTKLPLDKTPIRENLTIVGLELVGNYAIRIEFDDLHATGIYAWSFLQELASTLPKVKIVLKDSKTITLGANSFHYLESRPSSTSPSALHETIVCLHGFNQTAHSWDEFVDRVGVNSRVLALDQRNHGDSYLVGSGMPVANAISASDHHPEDISLGSMVDDVHQFVTKLSVDKFVLIGMSMGALHSLAFTSKYADAVKKLVLIDWAPKVERQGIDNILKTSHLEANSLQEAAQAMHRANPTRSLQQLEDRLRHSMMQKPNGKWGWRVNGALWARRLMTDFTEEATAHWWDVAARIQTETMLIRGQRSDVLSADVAAKFGSTFPRGKLVEVANAGHSVPGDNPDGFFAAVDSFLM